MLLLRPILNRHDDGRQCRILGPGLVCSSSGLCTIISGQSRVSSCAELSLSRPLEYHRGKPLAVEAKTFNTRAELLGEVDMD